MHCRTRLWVHELAHAAAALKMGWFVPLIKVKNNKGVCYFYPVTSGDFLFNVNYGIVIAAPFFVLETMNSVIDYDKQEKEYVSHLNPDNHPIKQNLQSVDFCNLLYKCAKKHWKKPELLEPHKCKILEQAVRKL